ncbi:hypothetical protein [Bradyrhizobium neotropicale]|uniref:hypothetical protein n=1 Tax=Bradyrhizobium neotropicale TaxID=1497615 RepID=UPI001AD7C10B|nr:hypothetical protein [Bradyrhizobium neotropicale]MBO4228480.1 hypothetical protein [Bradyrhizobium neotropicale]
MADPFSTAPATRLYRTGDLARYLLDGNLEFLGRYPFVNGIATDTLPTSLGDCSYVVSLVKEMET